MHKRLNTKGSPASMDGHIAHRFTSPQRGQGLAKQQVPLAQAHLSDPEPQPLVALPVSASVAHSGRHATCWPVCVHTAAPDRPVPAGGHCLQVVLCGERGKEALRRCVTGALAGCWNDLDVQHGNIAGVLQGIEQCIRRAFIRTLHQGRGHTHLAGHSGLAAALPVLLSQTALLRSLLGAQSAGGVAPKSLPLHHPRQPLLLPGHRLPSAAVT
jgi:hypothetical protein